MSRCQISTTVCAVSDWPRIAPLWAELADTSPFSSFFLSREWVESWLEVFGPLFQVEVLLFHAGKTLAGACLLVYRTEWEGPFRIRRVYLNTGGEDQLDTTYVEFNSLLCRPGCEQAVAEALAAHLGGQTWDELVCNGFCQNSTLQALETVFSDLPRLNSVRPSYYVNLDKLRESNVSYESVVGQATRRLLRQSFRAYGDPQLQAAQDLPGALEMVEELSDLHQRSWLARGLPGSFASPLFFAFHRALIRRAFPRGAIQLLRVMANGQTIGTLYNFVQRGKVYFYQSGLCYTEDNRKRPGFVTHACAIQFCLEQGFQDYDFLAGDDPYKRSLSTDSRNLAWVVFHRRSPKLLGIDILRWIKRSLKKSAVVKFVLQKCAHHY